MHTSDSLCALVPAALKKVLLLCIATSVALLLAELALRALASDEPTYVGWFEDADRERIEFAEQVARGNIDVGTLPRNRGLWAKEHTFYICYSGAQRPYLDERGCVRNDINQFGMRDRSDLTVEKPAGHKRLLCLGDSFTFGWGVAEELIWVRQVESALDAESDATVRALNAGSSGTLLIDECWWGLRDRFGKFEPDFVLQTICLNDLVPMPDVIGLFTGSTLPACAAHDHRLRLDCEDCVAAFGAAQSWTEDFALTKALASALRPGDPRLAIDPTVDWGQWLLDMPTDWQIPTDMAHTYYERTGTPPEATWSQGGPQNAMRAMRDWCREREIPFAVVVWPLFQGLETDRQYPFETLHRVVREFGAAEDIPVLDLLPTFQGQSSEAMWVDPSDPHANEVAHALAAPVIAEFVQNAWPTLR